MTWKAIRAAWRDPEAGWRSSRSVRDIFSHGEGRIRKVRGRGGWCMIKSLLGVATVAPTCVELERGRRDGCISFVRKATRSGNPVQNVLRVLGFGTFKAKAAKGSVDERPYLEVFPCLHAKNFLIHGESKSQGSTNTSETVYWHLYRERVMMCI
jgi:hypothetical protein